MNNDNNEIVFINNKDINKQLLAFRTFLLDYNKHTNLTAITDLEEFNLKHLQDALQLFEVAILKNKSLLDIGSGGGIPGLVFAIVEPTCKVTMIDSNNKKTKFLESAIVFLKLTNVSVINQRIENLKAELAGKFDVVTARAVAPTNILLELSAFSCKIEGKLIFYKGNNALIELPANEDIVNQELGIKFEKQFSYQLGENLIRNLIIFKKFKETKPKYPRDYAQIKKNPLY